MNSKKLFGVKNISTLIYGLAMLFPMFSILARVIYIQVNPNAKDSYYGETINEKQNIKIDYTNLKNDNTYIFNNLVSDEKTDIYGTVNYLYLEDVKNLNGFNNNVDLTNTYRLRIYLTNTYNALEFQDSLGNQITSFNEFQLNAQFSFVYKGVSGDIDVLSYYNYFYQIEYNKYSYLDNAFEYSIASFTKDNNLGNVDMFGWFTNLFLDGANPTNALYIGFLNWYLNYTLLVSSGYLIFLVLIWFINFVRRILDKSMYQDYGGF